MKTYTTRDAAELLGISEPQVRAQARAGFLSPGRGPRNSYRFSFQDLVLLRTAKALSRKKLPTRRIRRELRYLKRQLPEGRSLSGIRITTEGEKVLVRDGSAAWNPATGQIQLDLAVKDFASEVAPLARRAAKRARESSQPLTAAHWYQLGVDLEAAAPPEAAEAYAKALALDHKHADAHVNLGRLLAEAGKLGEAIEHYQAALEAVPKHSTAAFNLGIALEDQGKRAQAITAYERALAADPDFADAHYNLSRLYEQIGKRAAAIRHLSRYRMLVRGEGSRG
jgi:tetratricopeptide (TPR) repeat protein